MTPNSKHVICSTVLSKIVIQLTYLTLWEINRMAYEHHDKFWPNWIFKLNIPVKMKWTLNARL